MKRVRIEDALKMTFPDNEFRSDERLYASLPEDAEKRILKRGLEKLGSENSDVINSVTGSVRMYERKISVTGIAVAACLIAAVTAVPVIMSNVSRNHFSDPMPEEYLNHGEVTDAGSEQDKAEETTEEYHDYLTEKEGVFIKENPEYEEKITDLSYGISCLYSSDEGIVLYKDTIFHDDNLYHSNIRLKQFDMSNQSYKYTDIATDFTGDSMTNWLAEDVYVSSTGSAYVMSEKIDWHDAEYEGTMVTPEYELMLVKADMQGKITDTFSYSDDGYSCFSASENEEEIILYRQYTDYSHDAQAFDNFNVLVVDSGLKKSEKFDLTDVISRECMPESDSEYDGFYARSLNKDRNGNYILSIGCYNLPDTYDWDEWPFSGDYTLVFDRQFNLINKIVMSEGEYFMTDIMNGKNVYVLWKDNSTEIGYIDVLTGKTDPFKTFDSDTGFIYFDRISDRFAVSLHNESEGLDVFEADGQLNWKEKESIPEISDISESAGIAGGVFYAAEITAVHGLELHFTDTDGTVTDTVTDLDSAEFVYMSVDYNGNLIYISDNPEKSVYRINRDKKEKMFSIGYDEYRNKKIRCMLSAYDNIIFSTYSEEENVVQGHTLVLSSSSESEETYLLYSSEGDYICEFNLPSSWEIITSRSGLQGESVYCMDESGLVFRYDLWDKSVHYISVIKDNIVTEGVHVLAWANGGVYDFLILDVDHNLYGYIIDENKLVFIDRNESYVDICKNGITVPDSDTICVLHFDEDVKMNRLYRYIRTEK